MITQSAIYWLTRLDSLKNFIHDGLNGAIIFFAVLLSIASVITLGLGTMTGNGRMDVFEGKSNEELKEIHSTLVSASKRLMKYFAGCVTLLLTCSCVNAFIPSSKELAAIIVIPKIANSESVQSIGDDIVGLAKDWLHELHPKKASDAGNGGTNK